MSRFTPAAGVGIVFVLFASSAAAQDMPLSQILIEGEGWELVAEGFKFTEGPAADAEGNVFFTDVPNDNIHKIDLSGRLSVFVEQSHKTNGLMFGPGGLLYGCQNGMKRIVAYDKAGQPTTIAEEVACNDIVVTRAGGVYFTDPENKQVWYVDPQRKKRVVDSGIERPNGLILWPDQKTLVVADTAGPHLWAFRIEPDGGLTHKERYYPAATPQGRQASGADGMTVDRAGRLYVATYLGLQVFDTQGRLSGIIARPQEKFLSNAAFGGPMLDTLYVTCSDKVYRRKVKATGVRYTDGGP
jgi:gluconolactonase